MKKNSEFVQALYNLDKLNVSKANENGYLNYIGHQIVENSLNNSPSLSTSSTSKPKIKPKIKIPSFKQAFNQARNSGLQEFIWNGKRFNTKKKGEENFVFQGRKWVAPQIDTTPITTPIINTTPSLDTPLNQQVSQLNLNTPQQTYDRTGIREYLRSKGLNPYSFSGAQRRALRMVMNGQGTDNDKLLVKGMNIFKRGGLLLPSRNPVIRFRNRNFK